MKKNQLPHILMIIIITALGCHTKKNTTENLNRVCDTLRIATRYDKMSREGIPTFITDSFTSQAAETFSIESLRKDHSELLPLRKEPFRNIHDTTVIDTIYHFSGARDTITFYSSRRKNFMIYLHLTSPELVLGSCIRPGMSRETFRSVFGISKPFEDAVQLANSDGTLRFIFYFEGDVLKSIKSDIYFG